MKNLQHLHLNIVCGDIMVNVLIFIMLFFTVLTIGVVVFLLYIAALSKLLDWLLKHIGK